METIDTFSDLLNTFVESQNKVLDAMDIKHPTTIGSMYEGLSKDVLQKTIFKGIDLRVITNSFIEGSDTEFDVMIAEGEGERIPYTERYRYPANQVLVVVQVKKNLYGNNLKDSYKNLQFIIDQYENGESEPWMNRMFINAFRGVCGKTLVAYKNGDLNIYEEMVFHSLRCESVLPLRIVWGYGGFASEHHLRKAFADFLSENKSTMDKKIKGFGPNNFPNLIICGDYTIMKMDGMPYIAPMDSGGWWTFYTTSHYNKMRFLLESIWTRLSYKYSLPQDIFGEDLQREPATVFLRLRYKKEEETEGWEFDYWQATEKQLNDNYEAKEWKPVEIDKAQFSVLRVMGERGSVNWVDDHELHNFVKSEGYASIEEFVKKFCEARLVCIEGKFLKYLTDECVCVCCDGKWYAADNKDNRLRNWAMRQKDKKIEIENDVKCVDLRSIEK